MAIKFANNASTTLATDILANTTTISVISAAAFPSLPLAGDYFLATIEDASGNIEILKVSTIDKGANTFTLDSVADRGFDSTTARAFAAGSRIELRIPAAALNDVVESAIGAAQYNESTYAVDANSSSNIYDVTYTPTITSLVDGLELWFKPGASNTGEATLDVNDGSGAKKITYIDTNTLSAQAIIEDTVAHVVYSSQHDRWLLQNPVLYSTGIAANNIIQAGSVNAIEDTGIPSDDVFHGGADSIPNDTRTYDLGSRTNTFDDLNVATISPGVTYTDTVTFTASPAKFVPTTVVLTGLSVGDRVVTSGAANAENNGTWTVTDITNNEVTVLETGFINESPAASVTITNVHTVDAIVDVLNSTTGVNGGDTLPTTKAVWDKVATLSSSVPSLYANQVQVTGCTTTPTTSTIYSKTIPAYTLNDTGIVGGIYKGRLTLDILGRALFPFTDPYATGNIDVDTTVYLGGVQLFNVTLDTVPRSNTSILPFRIQIILAALNSATTSVAHLDWKWGPAMDTDYYIEGGLGAPDLSTVRLASNSSVNLAVDQVISVDIRRVCGLYSAPSFYVKYDQVIGTIVR